jgi:hypothetical protein
MASSRVHTPRLDEIQDKRQGMIQRLKISEKEKDSLEGKKAEAELFLVKQVGGFGLGWVGLVGSTGACVTHAIAPPTAAWLLPSHIAGAGQTVARGRLSLGVACATFVS